MIPQSLFNQISYNVGKSLTMEMAAAEKSCGLSREQIVDQMNDLAEQYGVRLNKGNGKQLRVDTLEKWLNPNDLGRTINVKALVIFCAVVKGIGPMQAMVQPLGWQLVDEKEAKLLRWAKEFHRAKEARKAMKKIEEEL